nr:integrase, catalytic region, zinc finger, CCHC-type, peptidase aspartic, catalytic [Tanacetum cinerariifolium]
MIRYSAYFDNDKQHRKLIADREILFDKMSRQLVEMDENSENDCQVVKNVCDDLENLNVIAPGMFKLSVSQSDSLVSVSNTSCASNKVETKTKRKRRNRNSSKQNDKQVNNDLRANRDFVHFLDLNTLSSIRRHKPSGVIWKKKGSFNTVKADLSSVNHSNLNKNVKRYNHKDLLSCNNSHLVDTKSEYDCNAATHANCNSYDVDVKDLFIFDDVNITKSQVSKMPFRKKPSASLNMPSRNNSKKSLSRNVLKWLPKLQPLAEPVAKLIPRVILCSKHMTGNRILLTNFVEKLLGTVRFGNNDFAVIAGYGDVIIGSMMIKKVYYVEDPIPLNRPTIVEVPSELPKVSMVNTSLQKLKRHLAGFDVVVKERTMATSITEGSWGVEHTKACFRDEIIPFVKALKDLFNTFDQYLIYELTEVQNVFHQIEQAVDQHRLESKTFGSQNERLLEQVISKDIVNITVNASVNNAFVSMSECKKCLELENELLNKQDFIEKENMKNC